MLFLGFSFSNKSPWTDKVYNTKNSFSPNFKLSNAYHNFIIKNRWKASAQTSLMNFFFPFSGTIVERRRKTFYKAKRFSVRTVLLLKKVKMDEFYITFLLLSQKIYGPINMRPISLFFLIKTFMEWKQLLFVKVLWNIIFNEHLQLKNMNCI